MIKQRTTITQIAADTRLKPSSALWVIVNDGDSYVKINNQLILSPGDRFGIDLSHLLSLTIHIQNETEFGVSFGEYATLPVAVTPIPTLIVSAARRYSADYASLLNDERRNSCKIIETTFSGTSPAMKITYETTITPINTDQRVKPSSALWSIVNDGTRAIYLNNNYKVRPGDRFGIDATSLFTVSKNVDVENETEFDVRFGAFEPRFPNDVELLALKSSKIIETFFKIVN